MKKDLSPKTGVILSIVGICLAGLGYYLGEVDTVFLKAVKICLECIGIG